MELNQFENRKVDHIREALRDANQVAGYSGLQQIHLFHDALPEIDLSEVSLLSTCLGSALPTPLFVCGMTAGHAGANALNEVLADACQSRGWAMGVGSQRRELETEAGTGPDAWKEFRVKFPKLMLFGNIGASQLAQFPLERFQQLVDTLEVQALCVHLNALQEAIQPEGTPQFKGVVQKITQLCRKLSVPVVIKETGCGFSPLALKKLKETGISAIDVSGLGGTHWGRIEGARAEAQSQSARLAQTFSHWGESTVDSLIAARQHFPKWELWASGGVRTGLDAAKLFALGADLAGFAKPALEHAIQGEKSLQTWMEQVEAELRVALFCTGSRTPAELKAKEGAWTRISI